MSINSFQQRTSVKVIASNATPDTTHSWMYAFNLGIEKMAYMGAHRIFMSSFRNVTFAAKN